ncbi:tetratricopeptide repeat protein [Desulfococcaceae bacterium HSG7]|nr:tetratricopeptide repeat protein [Desulfococcaceae bacterium HSG7]
MNSQSSSCKTLFNIRPEFLINLFLVIIILSVYWQVRNFEFTRFDDGVYIYENHHIKDGLTFSNIVWAFTSDYAANWHPLTWISHIVDMSLYGMDSGRHHLTNVILHIINTLLLLYFFNFISRKLWVSGFIAALFALHPLHVESVAWVAERKDLLSTLWGVSALISYVRYVKYKEFKWYLFALFFFIVSLMSKPMLVTLPFILLLLDYWPLKRFSFYTSNAKNELKAVSIWRLILEKLPFFVLAAGSGIVTVIVQKSGGAVAPLDTFALDLRIGNAMVSYLQYIWKMIWPCGLAVFYPHPGKLPLWQIIGAFLLLMVISVSVFRYGRQRPYLMIGWLWYLIMLIPVIGLVQVGSQAMADRYTYLPLTGLFIIITWGGPELLSHLKHYKAILSFFAIATICILTFMTWMQVSYWKNDSTLFQHALDVTQNNYLAHNNLGLALARKGELSEAVLQYSKSLQIKPSQQRVHNNWGITLAKQGKPDEALTHFNSALHIDSSFKDAHNNIGFVLANQGKLDKAIHHYNLALRKDPFFIRAHNNLATALLIQGRTEEAAYHYSEVLRINPHDDIAHKNLRQLYDKKK